LEIQGIKQCIKFECTFCCNSYTQKINLQRHQVVCNELKIHNITLEHKNEINELQLQCHSQKECYENQIKDQKECYENQIKTLQDKLENIALKAVSRPINTTNNQVNINNYLQKLDRITDQHFLDEVPKLTIEHIKKGPGGYAEYALKHPLNNRLLCVDYSRRKVKYKDKDGNVITDPEMNNISSKLFQAIKVKNKSLIVEYLNALSDEMDTEERLGIMGDMSDYMIMVNNGANGTKNDLYHEFIKNVCSKSIVD
jgi:hypothetical protein